jgi:hypothetical protein
MGDKIKIFSNVPDSSELSYPEHLFVIDRKEGVKNIDPVKLQFVLRL